MPAEIPESGEELKCGLNPAKQSCSAVCDPKQQGKQVLDSGELGGVSTESYCLLECKMIDTDLGSPCVALTYEERAKQTTEGGNGKDVGLPPDQPIVPAPKEPVIPPPPPPPKKEPTAEEKRDNEAIGALTAAAIDALEAAKAATGKQ